MTANPGRPSASSAPERSASGELFAYFASAFAISWGGVALLAAQTGLPATRSAGARDRFLVFLCMLAGPATASVGLTLASRGSGGLRELLAPRARWRVAARWYAAALVAPLAMILSLGVLSLTSDAYVPRLVSGGSIGAIAATALVGGLGAGFFEELGWTGFATPRLLARTSWQRAGLLLGLVWGAWHTLADYWGGSGYGTLWGVHMLEWSVALAAFRILMTWIYSRAESLLLGVLLHASFTGSQLLLWPRAQAREELIWYALFAGALWVAVAAIARRQVSPGRAGAARRFSAAMRAFTTSANAPRTPAATSTPKSSATQPPPGCAGRTTSRNRSP